MAKRLYIANWKIDCIRVNGVDRILLPMKGYELDEEIARPFLEGPDAPLRMAESEIASDESDPIPDDFPHYEDLIKEQEDTPTFRTLDDLRNATDEELESKHGIGSKGVLKIREALQR